MILIKCFFVTNKTVHIESTQCMLATITNTMCLHYTAQSLFTDKKSCLVPKFYMFLLYYEAPGESSDSCTEQLWCGEALPYRAVSPPSFSLISYHHIPSYAPLFQSQGSTLVLCTLLPAHPIR